MQPIRHVPYEDIDKVKWDNCIRHAPNGLIYGLSVYLDQMAKKWDALVLNDYTAVMPLPYNRKYGIYYLYQPYFIACGGVFGTGIDAKLVSEFLNAIPEKFRYWDFCLNHGNYFPLPDFDLYQRMNYVLPLQQAYETISGNYRENTKRNIRKSVQLGCRLEKGIPVNEVIALAKEQSRRFSKVSDDDYANFSKLFSKLSESKEAITYGIRDTKGQLLASAAFLFSMNRAYYMLVGNHPNGKTIGASHALIDGFIRDHCGQEILLDFEGSDIHSLAFFYSSFGANEEKYCGLKLNRLPAWAKWLKK